MLSKLVGSQPISSPFIDRQQQLLSLSAMNCRKIQTHPLNRCLGTIQKTSLCIILRQRKLSALSVNAAHIRPSKQVLVNTYRSVILPSAAE